MPKCQAMTLKHVRCRKDICSESESFCWFHIAEEFKEIKQQRNQFKAIVELVEEDNDKLRSQLTKPNKKKAKPSKPTIHSSLEQQVKDLKKQLEKTENQLNEANKMIKKMTPDYQNYQVLREFEKMKVNLDSNQIDWYERGNLYHRIRFLRNQVAHPVA